MVDILLMLLFSWRIHRMAGERGLSAWIWVSRFVSGYFIFGVLFSFALIYFYGMEALNSIDGWQKYALPWTPFILLFLVMWFIFLRSRILKYQEQSEDNEPMDQMPDNTPEKPDLSYFR